MRGEILPQRFSNRGFTLIDTPSINSLTSRKFLTLHAPSTHSSRVAIHSKLPDCAARSRTHRLRKEFLRTRRLELHRHVE